MKKSRFNSLNWTLLKIAIIPMILFMIIVSVAGSYFISKSMNQQVRESMKDINNTILVSLNEMHPGTYDYTEEIDGIHLFKGEYQFNGDFEYIDQIKALSNCDITICYLNYAVITTLTDNDGERLVGAGESQVVYNEVILGNKPLFYDDVYFNDELYYAYYSPLMNINGEVIGMLSVSMSAKDVRNLIINAIIPILLFDLVLFVIICIFVLRYSKNFVSVIKKMQNYMKAISEGEFRTQLDPALSNRTDEIGDMSKSAVLMASNLRVKVEEDQLTGLLNRRSADKKIKRTILDYTELGVKFSLVIGDIDFFKKVNDTYGHEAGDDVLKAVAHTLKTYMMGKGYAIRWGGEEFLLIYSDKLVEDTHNCMEELLNKVRALEIVNNDNHIKVTMSFGIVECLDEEILDMSNMDAKEKDMYLKTKMDSFISMADRKLYYAKEHGRNQIISLPLSELNDEVEA